MTASMTLSQENRFFWIRIYIFLLLKRGKGPLQLSVCLRLAAQGTKQRERLNASANDCFSLDQKDEHRWKKLLKFLNDPAIGRMQPRRVIEQLRIIALNREDPRIYPISRTLLPLYT